MLYGSMPICNGALILTQEQYEELIAIEPSSQRFVRQYIGGDELLNNTVRYCLWLKDFSPAELMSSRLIKERVALCQTFRSKSTRPQTKELAAFPYLFGEIRQPSTDMLVIPKVSSENRRYLPIDFVTPDIIVNGSALVIPAASLYHFGVLSSNVHNSWMRAVCGRMKSDYQYSASIVYNSFPWPETNEAQEATIAKLAESVLAARKLHGDSTLAQMYHPQYMHQELTRAHRALDHAVSRLYGFEAGSMTEAECVAELMKRYQVLTQDIALSPKPPHMATITY